jgi:Sec-independent protein secretion pathway component TatC
LIELALGAIVGLVFAPQIISFLVRFYRAAPEGKRSALVFTGAARHIRHRLKMATYGGIVLASPVWLWEL